MKEYYFIRKCDHKGCKEFNVYTYASNRQYIEAQERIKTWTCSRHNKPHEVLGLNNLKVTDEIKCVVKMCSNGDKEKFWQKKSIMEQIY